MGSSCSVPIKAEITNVIWIESEIDKDEIVQYTKDLEKNKSLNLFNNRNNPEEITKKINSKNNTNKNPKKIITNVYRS